MTRKDRLESLKYTAALSSFYRCPTTGRVIEGMNHDDKVLCDCGKTETPGTHIVSRLRTATAEEFLDQLEQDGKAEAYFGENGQTRP